MLNMRFFVIIAALFAGIFATTASAIIPTGYPTASIGTAAPYPTGSAPYPTAASSGFAVAILGTASGAPYPISTGAASSSGFASGTG